METHFRGPGGMASIFELTKQIKIHPGNAQLYAERSECYRIVQQHYHAVKDASTVISLRPTWHKGYYLKGLAEYNAEHYKSALESFEDGLQYDTSEEMIRALQKANRSWFVSRLTVHFRALVGLVLGCTVGVLALATNGFVLPKPIVENLFLKICIFFMWCYFGLESGKNFSKMLDESRDKRLEAPEELFPFMSDSSQKEKKSASVGTSTEEIANIRSDDQSKAKARRGKKQQKSW